MPSTSVGTPSPSPTPSSFSWLQYLAAGLSFRQVSQVIMETKEVLRIGSISSCSEGIVRRYVWFICSMNLLCIAELLRQCWAFSVALDMATNMATSYCDVRIRICHKSTGHDFRLLSIPVHERHTGETIFNTFAKAMDALFPDRRETITGAPSDGEKKMTGRHQGVITRIHRVAKPGFMCVWCGAHQTRLVYAVILLGHSRHVLLNIYIPRGVPSLAAELHLRRTEPVPSYLQHALAQHGQSDHLV
jgi:hypothetical protein